MIFVTQYHKSELYFSLRVREYQYHRYHDQWIERTLMKFLLHDIFLKDVYVYTMIWRWKKKLCDMWIVCSKFVIIHLWSLTVFYLIIFPISLGRFVILLLFKKISTIRWKKWEMKKMINQYLEDFCLFESFHIWKWWFGYRIQLVIVFRKKKIVIHRTRNVLNQEFERSEIIAWACKLQIEFAGKMYQRRSQNKIKKSFRRTVLFQGCMLKFDFPNKWW